MRPSVSIIVPCYNEQDTIGSLLGAIDAQTYPRERIEVVIADGMSQDSTRGAIAAFGAAHPGLALRVIDNVRRTIPSGLNLAMDASRGEIIVRMDAHSMPNPGYVERCVQDLESGKGSNVGGVWNIHPGSTGRIAAAIAAAAGHPLGAGDASYRLNARAGAVDTVPFGAFRRKLLETVGGFNEDLLTNEDYEFNTRIRRAGGIIWLDPEIQSEYLARTNLRDLAQQYWRYGYWKFRMLLRYPDSVRWRQVIPPFFVASVPILAILAALWRPALLLLGLDLLAYAIAVTVAGSMLAVRAKDILILPAAAAALVTMHAAWGCGFIWSVLMKALHLHG